MSFLLETKDLSVRFGGLMALDGVTLQVREHEILGVIGPNGAGKTTLFNTICLAVKPTSGEILFRGKRINDIKQYQIAKIGIGRTFQIVKPFSELSVMNNVIAMLGLNNYGSIWHSLKKYGTKENRDKADVLLDLTGLRGHGDEMAKNLPLGMLRRLEIARALALDPSLILLDESFSGLSSEEAGWLMELILKIRTEGKSIVLIEHNMKVALALSDRWVVLDYGRVIASGKPEEIVKNDWVIKAYLGEKIC
jgi:branched-chain amino acid transport system ATP-binding protein